MKLSELFEVAGHGGVEYEGKVWDVMSSVNIPGFEVVSDRPAGFSNVGSGDVEAVYHGQPFNIEIKKSKTAQMGGGSVRYDARTKTLNPSEALEASADPDDIQLILGAISTKFDAMDAYLKAAKELLPPELAEKIVGVPFTGTKEVRNELTKRGLTRAINAYIDVDSRHIANHYNYKGVYYLQIGEAGLFYLEDNPLQLPIPKFEGGVRVEARLGYAGGKKGSDRRVAQWRVIARISTKPGSSPYTLDNPKSVENLFAAASSR